MNSGDSFYTRFIRRNALSLIAPYNYIFWDVNMPQVKYIGTCIKTDSVSGVGLRWEPEQARHVTAEVAERLLVYSDTWVKVEDESKEFSKAEPIGLAQEQKPIEEPLPVIDFHGMDKKALLEFAQTKYNERLDKRQNEETLRHKVIALFGKHEMDNS